ncbi:copper-binding protein [Noviherbaspirillum galbum]|uniref:Copper-binding protein n=1 Tax=Noviherbaspirillum galbum TaxID=2709383 RepID=A0A6B3SH75_9BURK|nr:copper-binding protein [Noviherbaspirillum galbum]NEX59993.1 copper-binding protein [Noviherbaspirillum galbum]
MKAILNSLVAAALALGAVTVATAQSAPSAASAPEAMSTGEIKKVDKGGGRLTIKHGPLKNLGMDAMTMVFKVKDPAMLNEVKVGDKINFVADNPNGQLIVTRLEKQQ